MQTLAESFSVYELVPKYLLSNEGFRTVTQNLCDENAGLSRMLCSNIFLAMAGFTPEQLNPVSICTNISRYLINSESAIYHLQKKNTIHTFINNHKRYFVEHRILGHHHHDSHYWVCRCLPLPGPSLRPANKQR